MENRFRISVVIPAYNAQAYIERAIRSVLSQSRPADEIIVVDDGSTDHTAERVRGFDAGIKLIEQANAGVSAARNTGIRAAAGDWITFLDADDEWLPDFLKLQTELLNRNPRLVWSAANYMTCYAVRQAAEIDPTIAKRLLGGKDYYDDYFAAYQNGFIGCSDTMLIRKDVLLDAGLFPVHLRFGEDIDLWWRIAYRHPQIGFIPQPLAIYYLATPQSGSKQQVEVSLCRDFIDRHLDLSGQFHRSQMCEQALVKMLRLSIRAMLFDARGRDIRWLISQFPALCPAWYQHCMAVLTIFPHATAWVCRFISCLVRALHLRRRVVAPPSALAKH